MTARRRTLSIAAAVALVAGVALALLLVLRGDTNTATATAAGAAAGPHAPVTLSKEQRAAILNVIEATSASPSRRPR